MQAIQLKNIYKAYGEKVVLQNFSTVLPQGEVTALMGVSGLGKTTIARILIGLEKADSGEVEGVDNLRIGCVFQENRLCPQLSAQDNIALVLAKNKWALILPALISVGILEEETAKPAKQLSGGQQRRVALLRALEAENELLVLDEPFKGLDDKIKEKTMKYIKNRIQNRTVLLITHSRDEADYFAKYVLQM